MTTPDLTSGSDRPVARPVPDTDDLRILAELINNDSIPLANAAWNARMSQAEAAARLLTMAERGMPLRLVADGDRQALWRIAQAGPATGGFATTTRSSPTAGPTGEATGPTAGPTGEATGPTAGPTGEATGPTAGPTGEPTGPAAGPTGEPTSTGSLPPEPATAEPASPSGATSQPTASPHAGIPSVGGPYPPPTPQQYPSQPIASPLPPPPMVTPPPMSISPSSLGLPPVSAVPPHEQAIAGAVPLGGPPFGTPLPGAVETAEVTLVPIEPAANHNDPTPPAPSTWGIPGTADWTRSEAPSADPAASQHSAAEEGADESKPESPDQSSIQEASVESTPSADGQPADVGESTDGGSEEGTEYGRPPEPHDVVVDRAPPPQNPIDLQPNGPRAQSAVGLFGERLTVTLTRVLDQADSILLGNGMDLEQGRRAVLVETVLTNDGPIDHESPADLHLILDASTGQVLPRSTISVPGFPGQPPRCPAGQTVGGWTVFIIPTELVVAGVRWSVRPDLISRTLAWRF